MQRGPHHARPGVDAEDRTDVRRPRSGRQERFEFVGREPQRKDDPLTDGLPAHLPVVEAVQPLLSVAVLETEREPFRSVVPREMERRERILRTSRRIAPPLVPGQRMHPGVADDAEREVGPVLLRVVAVADLGNQRRRRIEVMPRGIQRGAEQRLRSTFSPCIAAQESAAKLHAPSGASSPASKRATAPSPSRYRHVLTS